MHYTSVHALDSLSVRDAVTAAGGSVVTGSGLGEKRQSDGVRPPAGPAEAPPPDTKGSQMDFIHHLELSQEEHSTASTPREGVRPSTQVIDMGIE